MTQELRQTPTGFFGEFGGSYVPPVVQEALDQLAEAYDRYKDDPEFLAEYHHYLKDYSGRETPLYYAESLTQHLGGAKIYLKREDLNHLGAHKLNNVIGQILLAKRMGKKKVIAETGAGQHGVATAAAAAKFGMECDVYMGALDVERQRLNVFRMEMLGATVHAVQEGERTLILILPWSRTSRRSLAKKLAVRFWKKKGACLTWSLPVWGAAPMPLEPLLNSYLIAR